MFQRTLDERSNPLLEDIPVLLGPITERFKQRPESTAIAPFERNLLDFHERIHKFVESVGTVGQRVKAMPEEELGCGVDRKASGEVLKVNRLVGFQTGDVVESPVDVFVEEAKIGCPVVGKEWACGCSMLQAKSHKTKGIIRCLLLTAFHISSSRFKIPDPRKVSLVLVNYIVTVGELLGILAGALSECPHERSLCDQSSTRT